MESTDKFLEIESVIPSLQVEYGLELDIFTVKELGAKVLKNIGNIYQTVYLYVGQMVNGELDVPCDASHIISVSNNLIIDYTGYPRHYNKEIYELQMLPEVKRVGEYLRYRYENGKLLFYAEVVGADKPELNETVYVVYTSQLVDERGFPKITWYEKEAIAAYCYYIDLRKRATVGLANGNLLQMYEKEYKRRVNEARVPEKITRNLIDEVLNLKFGYGLKSYGNSF
jgi:hypothetical protein